MRCRETDLNPILRLLLIRPTPKRCGHVRRYAYVNVHDSSIWAIYLNIYISLFPLSNGWECRVMNEICKIIYLSSIRFSHLFGVHQLFIQRIHSSHIPNWGIILDVPSRLTTRRKYELKDPPSRRSQAVRNGVKTPCLIASVSVTPGLHLAVT